MTGGAPGPRRAKKCSRSTGGGPGRACSRWGRDWARAAPREASVQAPSRLASSAREGASAGREPAPRRAFFPPLLVGRAVHVAPQPQCARRPWAPGGRRSVVVGGGGCVWGGGSVRNRGARQTASSFPW